MPGRARSARAVSRATPAGLASARLSTGADSTRTSAPRAVRRSASGPSDGAVTTTVQPASRTARTVSSIWRSDP